MSQRSTAAAAGAKTARACDGCVHRRARWYCAADDAFLCQECDSSVHSANPVARRHERVRLKVSSNSAFKAVLPVDGDNEPAWHHGFKRKARTPRGGSAAKGEHVGVTRTDPVVPDLEASSLNESSGSPSILDEEEQLLYRVPIFDPVFAEFCSPPEEHGDVKLESTLAAATPADCVGGFLASDMDLEEFEIDVESLLAQGLDEGSPFSMEGLIGGPEEGYGDKGVSFSLRVKEEEEIDVNFGGCGPPATSSDGDEKAVVMVEEKEENKRRRIMLSLDYESVISAWSTQGCPWTNGQRPQLDDYWLDRVGTVWIGGEMQGGGACGRGGGQAGVGARGGDGGREARVSRYREKRRTRLFSKKIRYEVRKLNAEKRPRMKGRFVKRSSLATPGQAVQPQFVF